MPAKGNNFMKRLFLRSDKNEDNLCYDIEISVSYIIVDNNGYYGHRFYLIRKYWLY